MKLFYNQDYNDITMSCHSNKMTALPILNETWRQDTMNNKRLSYKHENPTKTSEL